MNSNYIRLLCGCLAAGTAGATTPAEEKLFKAPMPHEVSDRRDSFAKVHWVRLQGYMEGNPDNATRLRQLKEQVQACVVEHRHNGRASNPPTAWPDFLLGMREDVYSSVNRTVQYSSGIAYIFKADDCSLFEQITSRAELVSSKGTCTVDLLRKTANGVCDGDAHAGAAVPPQPARGAGSAAALNKMASDPRMAAMLASIQQIQSLNNTRTGKTKFVLGVECDIWRQGPLTEGGTMCLARGGSFVTARSARNPSGAGLRLEYESQYGIKMRAVDVKLDGQVSAEVFAPYQAAGFTIANPGPRK